MALRTARSLVVRGRPPGCAAGRTGATQAHAALVRSVSGNRECIVRSLWPGSALFQGRRQLFKHPLNQRRSSSLGAASPHQASICIASFFIPRGHRRSTSNRAPSSFAAGSYTRLIWIIVICTSERPLHPTGRHPTNPGCSGAMRCSRTCPEHAYRPITTRPGFRPNLLPSTCSYENLGSPVASTRLTPGVYRLARRMAKYLWRCTARAVLTCHPRSNNGTDPHQTENHSNGTLVIPAQNNMVHVAHKPR